MSSHLSEREMDYPSRCPRHYRLIRPSFDRVNAVGLSGVPHIIQTTFKLPDDFPINQDIISEVGKRGGFSLVHVSFTQSTFLLKGGSRWPLTMVNATVLPYTTYPEFHQAAECSLSAKHPSDLGKPCKASDPHGRVCRREQVRRRGWPWHPSSVILTRTSSEPRIAVVILSPGSVVASHTLLNSGIRDAGDLTASGVQHNRQSSRHG